MGLRHHDARELLLAKRSGVDFGSMATIGRQQFYVHAHEARQLEREFGGGWGTLTHRGYAEPFFRDALGAREIVSIDVSNYEGAELVHDQNVPIDRAHGERFDAVFDCGSLEHIFNVPVALANLMVLTRVGGHVLLSIPANNMCGHGFYQFSPELMYRVFSEQHGFETRAVRLAEFALPNLEGGGGRVYDVVDPEIVRERVGVVSRRIAMMFVVARKLRHLDEPFASAPRQSDYVVRWAQTDGARRRLIDVVPSPAVAWVRGLRLRRRFSIRNAHFYIPRR